MSFKFPTFKSIQESLSSVDIDSFTKSIQNSNATKAVQNYSGQFASKVTDQLHQVQLAASQYSANVETSELPAEYLELEQNCDHLLKLYTDLIHLIQETYAKPSYDYPPGNTTFNAIKDAKIGSVIGNKFLQLRNASSPQDLENALLGKDTSKPSDSTEETTSPEALVKKSIPKTLFHQLSTLTSTNEEEIKKSGSKSISDALRLLSEAYTAIGDARLVQDTSILNDLNAVLITILDKEFIQVTELRKKVYQARQQFDVIRAASPADAEEDSEELIAKEDELVNATESAVSEMKKLLKPSKNVSLLKVLVLAQRAYFEVSAKVLGDLEKSLDGLKIDDEDYE